MSTKQMARTVMDGKMVTVQDGKTEPITGYLAGMDDFNWFIVEPSGAQHIIHKAGLRITIYREPSYTGETNKAHLEVLIAPFRRYVERTYFGRGEDSIQTRPVSATPKGLSA